MGRRLRARPAGRTGFPARGRSGLGTAGALFKPRPSPPGPAPDLVLLLCFTVATRERMKVSSLFFNHRLASLPFFNIFSPDIIVKERLLIGH